VLRRVAVAVDPPVWAAGGFVRDLVAGRRPYDLDLVLPRGTRLAAERAAHALGGHAFLMDDERETYRVVPPEGSPLASVDFTLLRGPTIEADLAARDFTLNAMAAELRPDGLGPLIDPLGGRRDVRQRQLRLVSPAALAGDTLRLLRAVRLATELGYEIEPDTLSAIRSSARSVLSAAAERRRDELLRVFATRQAARGLRLLDAAGLLDVIFPEMTPAKGVGQPERYHYYDVFEHCIETVAVLDAVLPGARPAPPAASALRAPFRRGLRAFGLDAYFAEKTGAATRLVLTKFAAFLHDVAKPQTKAADASGRVRFLGHSQEGARTAEAVCKRLRFGSRETHFVSLLVEEHLRPMQLSQGGEPSERAVFRFFRDLGEAAPACLVLSLADAAAALGPRLTPGRWQAGVSYVRYVLARGRAQAEKAGAGGAWGKQKRHFVSGDTLIRELGIGPGPEVGRLQSAIDEAAAAGEIATEEEAVRLARTLRAGWTRAGTERAGVA
jgi:poly(A) polymerase